MLMKVLFVASSMRIGGSEHVLCQLLRHLDRTRFEPHLALLSQDGDFMNRIPEDVVVHPLRVARARYATVPIALLCWRLRPDAVVSLAAQLNSAAILAKQLMPANTPLLVREGANITLPEAASALRRWVYRRLYRRADIVICQTEWMADAMRQDFSLPPAKLAVVYNPVDIHELARLADVEPYPYSGPGPHLLTVGRLRPVKGIDLLLDAMPELLKAFPSLHLTVIGDGPMRDALTYQQARHGLENNVTFLGFRLNPFSYMKHADLVVIPSRSEALPNVALEALALGTGVVATDCPGGIREIAEKAGRMWLAELTPESIAETVAQALTSSAKGERLLPGPDFLERFSLTRVVPRYEALLGHVVQDKYESRVSVSA